MEAQQFIKYGRPGEEPAYDILIHARNPIGKRPWHAYQPMNWVALIDLLGHEGLSVAAIGTEAMRPAGADDMRNIPLERLMNLMASCKIVAGPSSGPMHLASLCGAFHIVWTDKQWYSAIRANNKARYLNIWNPLNTPCRVIDGYGWQPPPRVVADTVKEVLACRR
jgi:ADP-heptose:LPS heptosyltransferase